MITTYTILRADGRSEPGEVDWPENPSLRQIEAVVEPIVGGDLEHVTVLYPVNVLYPANDEYRDMFVDELGHQHGRPRNNKATAIYRNNWLQHHGGDPEELPWIAGDAVVFDRIVWR